MKQMYKDMDPAVIKNEINVKGDLKISVKFVSDQNLLLVKVFLMLFSQYINSNSIGIYK